ncbi:glycosyltransferase [Mucilaginibacter roseus]|uniref:Glycosyltransferase n=1 Tax=Mucilaginibacter roseus TaxID=1528868 RepID=A0ABS8U4A0_9SPHI|nr:glycosyltransferase [Mucilaginibacter roseus]MCD8740868.1 glycosyltransferase [Mucilaginibacter roseus]
MGEFNLCIIKPNNNAFSETFIEEHIKRLPGNKKVLWGGAFPVYDDEGKFIITSKWGLLLYLIQKRLFKKLSIGVANKALANYFKRNKIDVVFAEYGMVGAMVTAACKIARIPLVIHYHGADVHHSGTVKKYYDQYKEAFKYASAFIAVSGDMVEALKQLGAPANKITLASCGVDTQAFPQLDISSNGRNFISIGRFVEKKSPLSVVKAFKIVADEYKDATLNMVGNGPLFDETAAFIKHSGLEDQVILKGVLKPDAIKSLLKQSRCFVQHSVTAADGDKEGTPVSILEAGSSGLAIVSTLHAGIKEAVIHGKTGYLVPEHDIDSMGTYMVKIAADVNLVQTLGNAGAQHIRNNYDINARIKTLSAILYSAMGKKAN